MENSVIIVGNGISILNKENGKKINKFTSVYRFYPNKTDKYEKFIGDKTTHLVVPKKIHRKISEGIKDKEIKNAKKFLDKVHKEGVKLLYTNDCFLFNDDDKKRYHELNEDPIAFIPEQYVTLFELDKQEPRFIPRSGLKLVFLLLKTFEQVTIYGFDIFGLNKKDDIKYGDGIQHYWGKQSSKTAHEPQLESKILLYLIKEGKVNVL